MTDIPNHSLQPDTPSFRFDWKSHGGIVRFATLVIGVAMSLWHMYVIAFGAPDAITLRGTHLLFSTTLVFLFYRRTTAADGTPPSLLDYALLVLAAAPVLHLFINYDYVINRIFYIDDLTTADMIFGTIMVVMVLEGTRRVIGWALPITAMVFLAYALFVQRIAPDQIHDQLYMTTEGIFGIPLAVSATYVVIFVLFGSFLERTGIGQLIMDFALSLTGHTAGGPGKVSVVSSSLFGTVSGSAVANVMVDGPIAIPLMKRTGFPPHFAAGVEATASTGGQIMPPIMGAAAFVMAEFLSVSYLQVVVWAIIPAFLYYVACFGAVHFEAKRRGLEGMKRSELPVLKHVLAERGHLFLPIVVILVVMYSGYSAPMAALLGVLSCFPVAALRKSTRHNVNLLNIIDALHDGARNALTVALACACAGIVIGVVTLTGLGIIFTQVVVHLSQDTLLLALVLTMFAGIILGMGMPTTPAYIVMTALLVPAINRARARAARRRPLPHCDRRAAADGVRRGVAHHEGHTRLAPPPAGPAARSRRHARGPRSPHGQLRSHDSPPGLQGRRPLGPSGAQPSGLRRPAARRPEVRQRAVVGGGDAADVPHSLP